MTNSGRNRAAIHSDAELAGLVVQIAEAAQVDAIVCVTESGALAQQLVGVQDRFRLIAATANPATHNFLAGAGFDAIRLPLHALDKYRQIRYILSVALRTRSVAVGDFIICAIGCDVYAGEGNLLVLADVESSLEELAITDLLKLTDGIRPQTLEAALTIACKVGRAARRGKRIGSIFMLGDSINVLEGSRQLVPNPFLGHPDASRKLTNPAIHNALVELSKLDGAFVVRGDGFIQTAGAFLATSNVETEVPAGLGARHAAAAAVTVRTAATAVVVSATDGNVRVFSHGRMVMHMDPNTEFGPINPDGTSAETEAT